MKKYLIQILVILVLLIIAWGLYLISEPKEKTENSLTETSDQQSLVKLPIGANIIPIRDWSFDEPEILAQSAIIANFKPDEELSILYKKNIDDVLPIASLTKIMTAIIALENFDLEETIKVSEKSVLTLGDTGGLIRGEELRVKDLLYIMLIESSNDAAVSLANDSLRFGYNDFIGLMNSKAEELRLSGTSFVDPAGLSPVNQSTVFEMAKLVDYALNFPFLWEILNTSQTTIYSIDNKFVHNLVNTNQLLNKISFLKGGKTGYTEEANGCMLTVSEISTSLGDNNYLITVVLGSDDRESDTESLITWAKQAYQW